MVSTPERTAGKHKADRGALVDLFLNEQTYALVDELEVVAKSHETTAAAAALAWVHAQPAVSSVIIGARRLSQLEDNVRAVVVYLTGEELARRSTASQPRSPNS